MAINFHQFLWVSLCTSKKNMKKLKHYLTWSTILVINGSCVDVKMFAFFLGQQGGYTKCSCFLCLWNSRADDQHYSRKQRPLREELAPGTSTPSSERKDFVTNASHKAWACKAVIKALKSDSKTLSHVKAMFPKLSEAKVKGGIFTGPQIRQMLGSKELEDKMTAVERDAWQSFRNVVYGFLGRSRADNYKDSVQTLPQTCSNFGSRMSLKMHYLLYILTWIFSGQIWQMWAKSMVNVFTKTYR